jgi:hypothetical protein
MRIKLASVCILACVFALPFAQPAKADLDYRCLNLCTNAGRTGTMCMAQCNHDKPKPPPSADLLSGTASVPDHNVLPTLHEGDGVILPKAKAASGKKTTDYSCMADCLKAKMQYQTCSDNCAVLEMPDGSKTAPAFKKMLSEDNAAPQPTPH